MESVSKLPSTSASQTDHSPQIDFNLKGSGMSACYVIEEIGERNVLFGI